MSSTEAEYIAATEACKEVLWLQMFLDELGFAPTEATTLQCDNQSAIALCRDSKFHARTKHMDIRYHFICEVIDNRELSVKYVVSGDNPADILTKALGKTKFQSFLNVLGLRAVD